MNLEHEAALLLHSLADVVATKALERLQHAVRAEVREEITDLIRREVAAVFREHLKEQALLEKQRLEQKRLRREREKAPEDEAGFDDLVEATIKAARYSSQHALRKRIGCGMIRLRRSLKRLTEAGRITKRPGDQTRGEPPRWVAREA